jgi:hypothetical protein
MNENLPEYERAVKSEDGSSFYIQTVKRKLVVSRPQRPEFGGSLYEGILPWLMVALGIVLIFILEGSASSLGRRRTL